MRRREDEFGTIENFSERLFLTKHLIMCVVTLSSSSHKIYMKILHVSAVSICNYRAVASMRQLRANVTIGQTFRGNSSKFNLAHILRLGRP